MSYLATQFFEGNLGKQINHITADRCLPIEAVGVVEDYLVLLWLAIQFRRRADECVYIFEIAVQTTFVVRNDHRWMWLLARKREEINFPLLHFTMWRAERAASLLDSLAAALS